MGAQRLSTSFEDYLEAIFLLAQEKKRVRVTDIAERLCVSKPSVTEALQKLARKELVNYQRYGEITLTGKGKKIAARVYKSHSALFDFFHKILCVDKETALKDACRMEHGLSIETLAKLIEFLNKK